MMIKNTVLFTFVTFLFSTPVMATNNLVWLGLTRSQFDYFSDDSSEILPKSSSIGFSHQISPSWHFAISYEATKGNGRWKEDQVSNKEVFKSANSESTASAMSFAWQNEEHSVTVSLSDIDNDEKNNTHMPPTQQIEQNNERLFSLSYDQFIQSDAWNFSWRAGTQYVNSDFNILQLIDVEPLTRISTRLKQTSWSAYVDFDFSYLFENQSFSWSPQLLLSWNWEVTNSNQQQISIFRNGIHRSNNRINQHLASNPRIPDSGTWELGINFDWHNNWGTSIAYSQSISTDNDINTVYFDINYRF